MSKFLVLAFGLLLRLVLFFYFHDTNTLRSLPHFWSPQGSFFQLRESLFFLQNQQNLYDSPSSSRAQPWIIYSFHYLEQCIATSLPWMQNAAAAIGISWIYLEKVAQLLPFLLADTCIAFCLSSLTAFYVKYPSQLLPINERTEMKDNMRKLSNIIFAIYFLNPFTVLSTTSRSLLVFSHLFVSLALYFATRSHSVPSALCLAIATYLELYPGLLAIPISLVIHQTWHPHAEQYKSIEVIQGERKSQWYKCTLFYFYIVFAFCLSALHLTSAMITSTGTLALSNLTHSSKLSFSYLSSTWGYILSISDLTPNIGIFWYFFTEIFDRFKPFFVYLFHTHIIVYIIPLTKRFAANPLFLCWVVIAIFSVFKAYPTVGDTAFSLGCLLVNFHLIKRRFRRVYPVFFLYFLSTSMTLFMWYIWIYPGSGNANFFYFQTLISNFTQAFVVMECVGSIRRLQAATNVWKIEKSKQDLSSSQPSSESKKSQ